MIVVGLLKGILKVDVVPATSAAMTPQMIVTVAVASNSNAWLAKKTIGTVTTLALKQRRSVITFECSVDAESADADSDDGTGAIP